MFPFFAPLSGTVTRDIETKVLKITETQKKVFEEYGLGQQLDALFAAVAELEERYQMSIGTQHAGTPSTGPAI